MQNLEPAAIEQSIGIIDRVGREQAWLKRWDEAPEDEGRVKLHLTSDRLDIIVFSDRSYFQALAELRMILEESEIRIECYGSCENVYPSPMIETMGYGAKAYKLRMGQRANNADLVSIFDWEPGLPLVAVADQRAFYDRWLESLT